MTTKNNQAWKSLFDKHHILDKIESDGIFQITASEINIFREARLMTKFDYHANLPEIFKDNDLAILPISRGSYLIGHFQAYKDFEQPRNRIIKVPFPQHIESIDYENITSESFALNCAYVSGILAHFLGDEDILPTVNGRMSSGLLGYKIKNNLGGYRKIEVENAQIEIDGGYEGRLSLALIEAKNSISKDFLIRQVYYPYKLWSNKVAKMVRPLFLTFSDGIFTFYEYEFLDPEHYNSLQLVRAARYSIEDKEITLEDIGRILAEVILVEEPRIPFPQANSFERVINLCELLNGMEMTREEITTNYDFDPRQTNYYTDAGRYLGLIEKREDTGRIVFSLTAKGLDIFNLKYAQRRLRLIQAILEHRPFQLTLKRCLELGHMPSKGEIVNFMKDSALYSIESENTFRRRASTISGWIKWIINLTSN